MRLLITFIGIFALGAVAPAGAQGWTEDRGELGTEADALALGQDVQRNVGPPAGSPRSGAELSTALAHVASGIRCPSCQSHSINDSPSENARNMKRQTRAMLAAGYDEQQVRDYFQSAYGEFVLMMPKAQGFNLIVFAAPVALVLLGLVAVGWTLKRQRSDEAVAGVGWSEDEANKKADDLDPWLQKVREELKRDG